jgi:hypothetical protein
MIYPCSKYVPSTKIVVLNILDTTPFSQVLYSINVIRIPGILPNSQVQYTPVYKVHGIPLYRIAECIDQCTRFIVFRYTE